MRILQINKYFYKKGGAETVFSNTINMLERNGHVVIPFCLKSEKNSPSPYDHYFVDYPELSESGFFTKLRNTPSFIYNREAARKIEELIIKEKPDIAHIHLLFNSLSVSILPILKKHNIPIVMTIHDYRLVCPAYTFTDGKGNFCEKCRTKRYYHCVANKCSKGNLANSLMLTLDSYFRSLFINPVKYIDQFIFVSKFSMQKHIDIDSDYGRESTYIYNFSPPILNKNNRKGDYILYFGRISGEKGINTLIDAVKDSPDIHLKVIGTGPLLDELKKGISSNVEFLGFKQGEDLISHIRNASFVVLPSECYENNPLSIVESYTIGTPVIASNIGGIPELVEDGKNGFLFQTKSSGELRETILKALSVSDEEYRKMSESALRFANDNFSEESHYKRLISIYEKLTRHKQ